jgi:hypothetical protein
MSGFLYKGSKHKTQRRWKRWESFDGRLLPVRVMVSLSTLCKDVGYYLTLSNTSGCVLESGWLAEPRASGR